MIISVFQLKHLISKKPGFADFQNVVYHFRIFKIEGDIAKLKVILQN